MAGSVVRIIYQRVGPGHDTRCISSGYDFPDAMMLHTIALVAALFSCIEIAGFGIPSVDTGQERSLGQVMLQSFLA